MVSRSFHRIFAGCLLLIAFTSGLNGRALAQDRQANAAAFIAQQQQEERYRRLYTLIEDLQANNLILQKRIERLETRLSEALKGVNAQQANSVTTEQFDALSKKMASDLKSLDTQRIADNQKILEELKKLAQRPVASPPPSRPATPTPELEPYTGPVYEITIEQGYTFSSIAQTYREQGHNITEKDIMRANPGVDPRRLKIGQVINVPAKE